VRKAREGRSLRFGGGSLSSSLPLDQHVTGAASASACDMAGLGSPTSSRCFASLEYPNDIKHFLSRQSIDSNSTGWTESDDCNTFRGRHHLCRLYDGNKSR
jgi:hypothetical protein